MVRILIALFIFLFSVGTATAQRYTDHLDRGLVAMKVGKGVFLSWRIQAEEYYDVTYNVYRDGTKLNDAPLSVSNFTDTEGTTSSTYTVTAIVNGQEQTPCTTQSPGHRATRRFS